MMSAEQFGTNLRATAAISIPNLVRGFLPLILKELYGKDMDFTERKIKLKVVCETVAVIIFSPYK